MRYGAGAILHIQFESGQSCFGVWYGRGCGSYSAGRLKYGQKIKLYQLLDRSLRMFMKVATVFMNAATAEQSCKALRLRLSGTPPRGAVYPTGV